MMKEEILMGNLKGVKKHRKVGKKPKHNKKSVVERRKTRKMLAKRIINRRRYLVEK